MSEFIYIWEGSVVHTCCLESCTVGRVSERERERERVGFMSTSMSLGLSSVTKGL